MKKWKLDFLLKQCPPLSAKSSSTSATSSTSGLQSPSASPQTSNPITQHLHGHHHHHGHGHHSGIGGGGGGATGTSSGVNYHFSHSIKLTERSRAALVSLLLLVVEHHHALAIKRAKSSSSPQQKPQQAELHQQFSPDLLNYLLTILENLPNFKWVEDAFVSPSTATYYYSSSISSKSLSDY